MDVFFGLIIKFSSVLILIILLVISKKDLNTGLNNYVNRLHIFGIFLIIVNILFRSLSEILFMYSYSFIIPVNRLINCIIFFIYPLIGCIYAIYISEWFNISYNLYIFLFSCFINFIFCILNLKYNILFEINIYNFFIKHTLFIYPFIILLFFCFYVLSVLIRRAKYIPTFRLIIFFIHVSSISACIIIEKVFPNFSFIYIFLALVVVFNYIIIQRQLPYLDPSLICRNKKALGRDLILAFKYKKEFSLIFFEIKNFQSISNLFGHSTTNECILDFVNVLLIQFKNIGIPYHLTNDKFIVILNNKKNIQTILMELDDAFNIFNETCNKPYLLDYSCKVSYSNDLTSLIYYLGKINEFIFKCITNQ